jgi:DNA-binding response OmpR family regulator
MNFSRSTILVVDPDAAVAREISRVVARRFDTIWQRDAARITLICEENPFVCVVIYGCSTQKGAGILEQLRVSHPMVHRILLSDYTDLSAIVNGLHSGAVQSVIHKPVDSAELLACVSAISPVIAPMPTPTAPSRLSA